MIVLPLFQSAKSQKIKMNLGFKQLNQLLFIFVYFKHNQKFLVMFVYKHGHRINIKINKCKFSKFNKHISKFNKCSFKLVSQGKRFVCLELRECPHK